MREALRDAEAGSEVGVVGIHEAAWISVLSTDEDLRSAAAQVDIAIGVTDVDKRAHELVAKAVSDCGVRSHAPCILCVAVRVPLTEIHLGYAYLALPSGREAEQKAGQRRARAIVERMLRGEAIGELVIAAILKEALHGPNEFLIRAAEFCTVAADLPVERIAAFDYRVPGVHGSGQIAITQRRETLHVEIGSTPRSRTAEACSSDSEFGNDVVFVGALSAVHHGQPRDGRGRHVDQV